MMQSLMAGEKRASGAGLRALLKEISLKDEKGSAPIGGPVKIHAKSGTLNFVSGLAGFMTQPSGRDLAFAIFSADPARREPVSRCRRDASRTAALSGFQRSATWFPPRSPPGAPEVQYQCIE